MLKLDRYTTHPGFWTVGGNTSIGKKYLAMYNSTSYDNVWVKSAPYGSTDMRTVVYEYWIGSSSPAVTEWELWFGDSPTKQAIQYCYGGATEATSRGSYQTTYHWSKGKGSRGFAWPEINDGETVGMTTLSLAESQTENGTYTGSIRIYLKETFGAPNSAIRIAKVNEYVPTSESSIANAIGKQAPEVALIWQYYISGSLLSVAEQYNIGCEATVYAWGYPYSSANNYRNWMRNGELRFSTYLGLGVYNPANIPSKYDTWWYNVANNALTQRENWIYSGAYSLNGTVYNDNGSE